MKRFFTFLTAIFFFVFLVWQTGPYLVLAQGSDAATPSTETEQIYQAQVLEVIETSQEQVAGQSAPYQLLKLSVSRPQQETTINLKHGGIPTTKFQEYQVGDQVFIRFNQSLSKLDLEQNLTSRQAQITGLVRSSTVLIIVAIFLLLVIAINGKQGLQSILSLVLSFAVIVKIVLPALLNQVNPMLVATLLTVVMIPITFYLSHGWQKKTHMAVIATILSLVVSTLLATTFINTTHLTGLASEEAGFLQVEEAQTIDIRGLLLAGIMIGLLGTLDDITVTQAGLVTTLKRNRPDLTAKQLYREAIKVGKDHMTSMVNTLVLVYAGASLPLLLLFIDNPHPFNYVLSQELVVEEIVRTMVSSIGLIIAAPLTTILAVVAENWDVYGKKLQVK